MFFFYFFCNAANHHLRELKFPILSALTLIQKQLPQQSQQFRLKKYQTKGVKSDSAVPPKPLFITLTEADTLMEKQVPLFISDPP